MEMLKEGKYSVTAMIIKVEASCITLFSYFPSFSVKPCWSFKDRGAAEISSSNGVLLSANNNNHTP